MKNKLIAIGILGVLAAGALFARHFKTPDSEGLPQEQAAASSRPLPDLSTAAERRQSYQPAYGDVKYRVVTRPVMTEDPTTGWSTYASKEYKFSFSYPPDTDIQSTEALGYQLPAGKAVNGSRDTLQIVMTNKRAAYYILLMNDPDFALPPATSTAESVKTLAGTELQKQLLQSTDPAFAGSDIIVYRFTKDRKNFVWYGTFDSSDLESINEFESIVSSMVFT